MRRLSWWQVALICSAYVLLTIVITAWRLVANAKIVARDAGLAADEFYVIMPHGSGWWLVLLVVPPIALVALQLAAPRKR